MKTKLYLLLLLFSTLTFAQDKICADKQLQLENYLKDKNFEKANSTWLDIKNSCAKYNEKNYLLATDVLLYNIEITNDDESKEKAVREFIKMLDLYDLNFPENLNANNVKSAMELFNNKVGTNDEIYLLLDKAFTKQSETFTNPTALNTYFKLYFDKFNQDNSKITKEDLLKKYSDITSLLIENSKKNPEKEIENARVNKSIKALMNDLLVCTNTIPYYEKNFETNKTDGSWLLSAANNLSQNCKTAKIYETIALQMHLIEPTATSATFLGEYYLNTRNQEKAINYYNQSVTLELDKTVKANRAFSLASIYVNFDKEKAKLMTMLALENDTTSGKYYIFLATLYANSVLDCGTTENEKMAIYQLAATTAMKAAKVEPMLKPTSEKLSADYLKNIDKKIKGKTIKINCWINETVQF